MVMWRQLRSTADDGDAGSFPVYCKRRLLSAAWVAARRMGGPNARLQPFFRQESDKTGSVLT